MRRFLRGFPCHMGLILCLLFFSLPTTALDQCMLNNVLVKILGGGARKLVFGNAVLTDYQVVQINYCLNNCNPFLRRLNIINLKRISESTSVLLDGLKNNATITTLDLSGSFLDDDAMDALISLLKKENNKDGYPCVSRIENLVLDKVIAHKSKWEELVRAIPEFSLRYLSMRKLRENTYCDILDPHMRRESRKLVIDDIAEILIVALEKIIGLKVDVQENKIFNYDILSTLSRNKNCKIYVDEISFFDYFNKW